MALEPTGFGELNQSDWALRVDLWAKSARFAPDPRRELGDLRMRAERFHGAVVSLELLFREHCVDLRVARPTNADDDLHRLAVERALVAAVRVSRARKKQTPRTRQ